MAYLLLRQRKAFPAAAAALAASAILYPRTTVHAEAPRTERDNLAISSRQPEIDTPARQMTRKPIYDDPTPLSTAPPPTPTRSGTSSPSTSLFSSRPSSIDTPTAATTPTPTDRLTNEIRRARLQLYQLSRRAEASLNNTMTRALNLESSLTNTIASLAPPPQANEPLMPGTIYVLVSTLAGSILSRNRGILLRGVVPVVFGVAAGYAVLPYTMRNIGDLVWRYEERFPGVRDTHLRVRERALHLWETGKAHTQMTVARGEGMIEEAKEKVEGWISGVK